DALTRSGRRGEAAALVRPILAATDTLDESARFAFLERAARVLYASDRKPAGRARAALRPFAPASGNPLLLAHACYARVGGMRGWPKTMRSEEARQLVEECLTCARQAGHPVLEAEACGSAAAWCWQVDAARGLAFIEAGLEAADAAKDLAARAGPRKRQA